MLGRRIFSILIVVAIICSCRIVSAATVGVVPTGSVSYVGEGELHDLLWLPWVTNRVAQYGITYCSLKCAEATPVDSRYTDALLYHGTVKFAGGNVVAGFALQKLDRNEDLPNDLLDQLLRTSKAELDTVKFVKSLAPLAGDSRNVVEMGAQPFGGLNAFWNTTRMERRNGKEIVWRGLQRTYIIPLGDRKTILSANFMVCVLGADQTPYADFKAFLPVGEKFIKSIRIRQQLSRHSKKAPIMAAPAIGYPPKTFLGRTIGDKFEGAAKRMDNGGTWCYKLKLQEPYECCDKMLLDVSKKTGRIETISAAFAINDAEMAYKAAEIIRAKVEEQYGGKFERIEPPSQSPYYELRFEKNGKETGKFVAYVGGSKGSYSFLLVLSHTNVDSSTMETDGSEEKETEGKVESVEECLKSAASGDATAQCKLGVMYMTGRGVNKNYDEAKRWFQRAKDKNADAQCYLGWMFENGLGVKADKVYSDLLYCGAADRGNAFAQNKAGEIFESSGNIKDAIKLYRMSAKQGNKQAEENLKRLGSR